MRKSNRYQYEGLAVGSVQVIHKVADVTILSYHELDLI
jgi:hypothetical protein